MGFELGPNRYGKAGIHLATVVRGEDRHEFSEREIEVRLEGDFEDVHAGRRQRDRPADRHDAERRLCPRVRASDGGARGVRAPVHGVPAARVPRGEPGRGVDVRAALGARRDRRAAPPPRVHARSLPMDDARGPRPGRGPAVRRARRALPVEDDRVGVQRLPQGPVHDPAGDRRPDPRDRARRAVAVRRNEARLRRGSGRPAGMRSSARSRTTTTAVRCSTPSGTWAPQCSRRRRTSRRSRSRCRTSTTSRSTSRTAGSTTTARSSS